MAETEREGGFTLSHFGLKGHETSSAGKARRVGRLYLWWQEQEAPGSQLCRERDRKQVLNYKPKIGRQPTPLREVPPTERSETSQNSTPSWGPSVQTQEPLLGICHANPIRAPQGPPLQSPHTLLGQASSRTLCIISWTQHKRQIWSTLF